MMTVDIMCKTCINNAVLEYIEGGTYFYELLMALYFYFFLNNLSLLFLRKINWG